MPLLWLSLAFLLGMVLADALGFSRWLWLGLAVAFVLLAVFGGIWLDARLGTRPWFTLGLLVLSIPISLAAMFYVVKTAVSKIKPIPPQATKSTLKEADLGDDA
jgi:hypothetical protein